MDSIKKRKNLVYLVLVIAVLLSIYYYFEGRKNYQSTVMYFIVEEKEHYIEPGKYMKMWVVGSNAFDDSTDKPRYKVMIKDSRIYNLLEENETYFVIIDGIKKRNQEHYVYTFGQLGLLDGTRLSGEGRVP